MRITNPARRKSSRGTSRSTQFGIPHIQNLITGNDLRSTRDVLDETQLTLADTRLTLADTEDRLALTLQEVKDAEDELKRITIDLDEAKLQLAQQQEDLAALDQLLADQRALIGRQEEYMKAASEELLAMRSQMQTIAVLRLSILEQIRDSMVGVMGGDAGKGHTGGRLGRW